MHPTRRLKSFSLRAFLFWCVAIGTVTGLSFRFIAWEREYRHVRWITSGIEINAMVHRPLFRESQVVYMLVSLQGEGMGLGVGGIGHSPDSIDFCKDKLFQGGKRIGPGVNQRVFFAHLAKPEASDSGHDVRMFTIEVLDVKDTEINMLCGNCSQEIEKQPWWQNFVMPRLRDQLNPGSKKEDSGSIRP